MKKIRVLIIVLAFTVLAAIAVGVVLGVNFAKNGQKLPVFTLSFEENGGSDCRSVKTNAGIELTLPTPQKEGFAFDGWFEDEACTVAAQQPFLMPEHDCTLYAKYSPVYTVTIYSGGKPVYTVTCRAGELLSFDGEIIEGYAISGMYSDEELTVPITPPQAMPEGGLVFYATLSKLFQLTVITSDGAVLHKIRLPAGDTITYRVPEREKFEFEGWYSDAEFTKVCEFPVFMPEADGVIYAKYARLYTLTFETDGGFQIPPVTGRAGASVPLVFTEKNGYRFMGWYADEALSIETYVPSFMPDEDKTFYAKYEKLYTLTFETGTEASAPAFTEIKGGAVNVPDPVLDGYRFMGWYADEERTRPEPLPPRMPDEDKTFYARFEKLYRVNFIAVGDTDIRTGIKGEEIEAPAVPELEGFTGIGWSETQDGEPLSFPVTVGEADRSFYAVYRRNPRLSFDANAPDGVAVTGTMPDVEGRYGMEMEIPVPVNTFRITGGGYRFAGWAKGAQQSVSVEDGERFTLSTDTVLYAVWARGYRNAEDSGVVVYDTAYASGYPVYVFLGEERTGSASENALDERELTFALQENFTVRPNADGTYSKRGDEWGNYTVSGGTVYFSGYGGVLYTKEGGTERGSYDFSGSSLVYLECGGISGSYRVEGNVLVYLDNDGVRGSYYGGDLTPFTLGDRATFRGNAGAYLAGGDKISFYFGGTQTQAEYDGAKKCFTYEGASYYLVEEEITFTDGTGNTLVFLPQGEEYTVQATLTLGGTPMQGELTRRFNEGLPAYSFTSGNAGYLLSVTFTDGVGRFEVTGTEEHTLLQNERTDYSENGSLLLTRTDGADGAAAYIEGEILYLEEGIPFFLARTEVPADEDEFTLEVKREELDYLLYFRLSEHTYRLSWGAFYPTRLSAGEGIEVKTKQLMCAVGLSEYEGTAAGAPVSFTPVADGSEEETALLLFSEGEYLYRGRTSGKQYHARFVLDGRGYFTGVSVEIFTPAYGGCGAYEPENDCLVLERDGAYFAAEFSETSIENGACLLRATVEETAYYFVYESAEHTLLECEGYKLGDGEYTVFAVAYLPAEQVFFASCRQGNVELGEAKARNGVYRTQSGDFYYDISFTFTPEFGASVTRSDVEYTSGYEYAGVRVTVAFLRKGEGGATVLSVQADGTPLTAISSSVVFYEEDAAVYFEGYDDGHGEWLGGLLLPEEKRALHATRHTAADGDFTCTVASAGDWYVLLPQAVYDNPKTGKAEAVHGSVTGEDGSYVWQTEEGALEGLSLAVKLTRTGNTFTVKVNGLPLYLTCEDASAEVCFNGNGELVVRSFVVDGEEEKDDGVAENVGGGRWYFSALGYLFTEGNPPRLEKVGTPVLYADGEYSVSVLPISDTERLPVRLFHSDGQLVGGFTLKSQGFWVFTGEEHCTIALSEESVQVFAGEPELVRVTLSRYDGTQRMLYASVGNYPLPTPAPRSGYTFAGWREMEEYSLYEAGTAYSLTRHTVFKEEWTKAEGAVSFYLSLSDLGGEPYAVAVPVNGVIPAPEVPEERAEDFLGWYYCEDGEPAFEFTGSALEGFDTVVALWKE